MRRLAVLPAVLLMSGLPVGVSSGPSMAAERGPAAVKVAMARTVAAAARRVTEGGSDDGNGDGPPDVVVADPGASVSGRKQAGLVQVRYGVSSEATGTKTT